MGQTNEPRIQAGGTLDYNTYLRVDRLLDLQFPLTVPIEHDEMLFILIHQVYELWFKQILYEIDYASKQLREDNDMALLRTLERVMTIQDVTISQVGVLETMTPNDFNRFRDRLNPASGFQSMQFRVLEFRLGLKDPRYLRFFAHDEASTERLVAALEAPSLYEDFLNYLARQGLPLSERMVREKIEKPLQCSSEISTVLAEVYMKPTGRYEIYMLCEALISLDERFLLWRQRHVAMVERMIGNRRGTGGSSGVEYLKATLDRKFFPEIWDVRNYLGGSYGSATANAAGLAK